MRRIYCIFGIILMISLFCVPANTQAASLSANTRHVNKGRSFVLKMKGTKREASWIVSNSKVVSVVADADNSCRVYAKKKGTTKVKCKVGKKTYTCRVSVDAPKVPRNYNLYQERAKTLKIKGLTKGAKAKWKVVDSTGALSVKLNRRGTGAKLTGLSDGFARLKIKVNGQTFISNVYVKHVCDNHRQWVTSTVATTTRKGLKRERCSICDKTFQTRSVPRKENLRAADAVIKWAATNIGVTRYSQSDRMAGLNAQGKIIATDCSGFVWWCYRKMGLRDNIPMWCTASMSTYFYDITPAEAKPGDVVYVTSQERKGRSGHARLYIGHGRTIECTGGGVRFRNINLNDLKGYHFGRIYSRYMKKVK